MQLARPTETARRVLDLFRWNVFFASPSSWGPSLPFVPLASHFSRVFPPCPFLHFFLSLAASPPRLQGTLEDFATDGAPVARSGVPSPDELAAEAERLVNLSEEERAAEKVRRDEADR